MSVTASSARSQRRTAAPAGGPGPVRSLFGLPEVRWAAIATALFAIGGLAQLAGAPAALWWAAYLACYASGGWAPGLAGLRALRGRTLDVDLLMVVAALVAAAIGQVFDGALLIVIFATSGALEAWATHRTAASVRALLELTPQRATRLRSDGGEELVDTAGLVLGDRVLVRPGELIGADAEVLEGTSEVDQASITGEPLPVLKSTGDEVFAGTLNGTGALTVKVNKPAGESVLARIVTMVEQASATKARTQLFIEKVEQRYSIGMVAATLLLPNSCQHCENPACMLDCPTGAIGRDPRGDVFIRESICIGCGNCAKGCPWDNIQMAPRAPDADIRGGQPLSTTVAVKCDVCEGRDEGPACVAACPAEAIARIVPTDAMTDVRIARGEDVAYLPRVLARPKPAWPWWSGAALLAVGVAVGAGKSGAFMTGVASALVCFGLAVYPLFKRVARMRALGRPKVADPERAHRSRVRIHYVAHVALGLLAIGLVFAHTHLHAGRSLTGALFAAFVVAAAFGGAGAFFYAFVPKALARLDRKGSLPEDVGPRLRDARDHTANDLSGKGELVKTIFARVLAPYVDDKLGTLVLIFSRRSLRDEERRLHGKVKRMLQGRGDGRLEGLDALVRDVVERRGLEGERWLHWLVRGWLAFHVVASVLVVALMIAHAVVELVYPR